ncbi:MAG: hypothetical protein VX955_15460 [Pseudomonadota bacterium]|nr:hypothetical protein [Pseudomonadota bacterium]
MSATANRGHTATKTPKRKRHRAIARSIHLVMFVATVIKLHLFSCGTHFSIKGQSCSIREAKLKVDFVTEPNWLFRLDEHHVKAAGDHLQQTARLNRDMVLLNHCRHTVYGFRMMELRAFVLGAFYTNDFDTRRGVVANREISGVRLGVGRRASDPTIAHSRNFAGDRGKSSQRAETDGG